VTARPGRPAATRAARLSGVRAGRGDLRVLSGILASSGMS